MDLFFDNSVLIWSNGQTISESKSHRLLAGGLFKVETKILNRLIQHMKGYTIMKSPMPDQKAYWTSSMIIIKPSLIVKHKLKVTVVIVARAKLRLDHLTETIAWFFTFS